jgi:hypothetical protein
VEFFSRVPTIKELGKLLRDQYREVDFRLLEEQLRESCEWSGCPVPRGDLHEALYGWVRDLRTLLEDSPEYRDQFQLPLQNAIRELSQSEALIRNDSRRALCSPCHVSRSWIEAPLPAPSPTLRAQ